MKGICGIDIDTDRTFVCFASCHKGDVHFLEETEIEIPFHEVDILNFLRNNSEILDKIMREKEQTFSLKIEKVYIKLPWNSEEIKEVENIVVLKKRKKLTPKDIFSIKKHVEELSLDWDDFCLHHFVTSYEIESEVFKEVPLGVWAKKVKLNSLLFSVKEQLRKEVWAVFDNLGRNFSGFVSSAASSVSAAFGDKGYYKVWAVSCCGYERKKY
jgi:cell division ATPase FtsA